MHPGPVQHRHVEQMVLRNQNPAPSPFTRAPSPPQLAVSGWCRSRMLNKPSATWTAPHGPVQLGEERSPPTTQPPPPSPQIPPSHPKTAPAPPALWCHLQAARRVRRGRSPPPTLAELPAAALSATRGAGGGLRGARPGAGGGQQRRRRAAEARGGPRGGGGPVRSSRRNMAAPGPCGRALKPEKRRSRRWRGRAGSRS